MTKAQTLIGRAETILLKNTHKTMTAASAAELHEAVATAAMYVALCLRARAAGLRRRLE